MIDIKSRVLLKRTIHGPPHPSPPRLCPKPRHICDSLLVVTVLLTLIVQVTPSQVVTILSRIAQVCNLAPTGVYRNKNCA